MGRLNTFRIQYGNLPNKPGISKILKFCANELGLKQGEVIRVQTSRALGVTFVTVVDLTLARAVCEEHGRAHEMVGSDGKKYPITLTMEDGAVEVKLYDLSVDVPNADVVDFLGKYGTVRGIYEEQLGDDQDFPGVFTGIRVARMVVTQNIDSWVTINGELTQVSYFGQRQTCRHCRDFLHVGATCVQNKKLMVQKTYADAAKQPAKPARNNQPNKQNQPTGKGIRKPLARFPKPPPAPQISDKESDSEDEMQQPAATKQYDQSPFAVPLPVGQPNDQASQQPNTSGVATRRPASENVEGNDTDTSVASSSSKRSLRGRPPGKKLRGGDNEREGEEKL